MPSDLWSFASVCYARPGVEGICLHLQQQGQDVCLLLCALWLEQRNVSADHMRLQQLRDASQPWQHSVVKPLRELRQAWRAAATHDPALAQLRERIKTAELEAEREQLRRLEQVTATWPAAISAPAVLWLELLGVDRDALQQLRVAASRS